MISRPQEVPMNAVVTAAQWESLVRYMLDVMSYMPTTKLYSSLCMYSVTTATSNFPSILTDYFSNLASHPAMFASVARLNSSGSSSGYSGYALNSGVSSAVPGPSYGGYSNSYSSAPLPSGTVYFGGTYRVMAQMTAWDGDWVRYE